MRFSYSLASSYHTRLHVLGLLPQAGHHLHLDGQVSALELLPHVCHHVLMCSLAASFPEKVKIEVIGTSHEGREIRVVRVGNRYAWMSLNQFVSWN